jgi:hypothetical protein
MAGSCEENGSWDNAKKNDGRKTVYRKKERKTPFEMDGRCSSRSERMRIQQWTEKAEDSSSGDWLSRRPRLTQGCSAEWMDGIGIAVFNFFNLIYFWIICSLFVAAISTAARTTFY